MRVLIVKTSSLGDVVHTLPAISDAKAAMPNVVFDWVVEEGFAEIPAWHSAVDTVIPCALRRWRRNIFAARNSGEWRAFKVALRKKHYDLVIDPQGLLKSALVCSLVSAPKAGYDWHSIKERLASLFYSRKYTVAKDQHAVERIRQLFAQSLGYSLPEGVGSCGLDKTQFTGGCGEGKFVFLHGTTREDKYWPESHWQALGQRLAEQQRGILLPWGDEQERERAERIASVVSTATVLPKLAWAMLQFLFRFAGRRQCACGCGGCCECRYRFRALNGSFRCASHCYVWSNQPSISGDLWRQPAPYRRQYHAGNFSRTGLHCTESQF